MAELKVKLDHSVVHVSDRERSDAFYRDVLGAKLVGVAAIRMYRFGDAQLNVHGPGLDAKPVARIPVPPGGSDICFEWPGPIEEAVAHLARWRSIAGPSAASARRGLATASISAIRTGLCWSSSAIRQNEIRTLVLQKHLRFNEKIARWT
jgi:catechol 2,3-dioxygenase-like lactoylglutathione lyase family enzyme